MIANVLKTLFQSFFWTIYFLQIYRNWRSLITETETDRYLIIQNITQNFRETQKFEHPWEPRQLR